MLNQLSRIAAHMIETGSAPDRSTGQLIEKLVLQHRAALMTIAAAEYVGIGRAKELSNNVAAQLSDGVEDPYQTAYAAISHRLFHFSFSCSDIDGCARAMTRAWEGIER